MRTQLQNNQIYDGRGYRGTFQIQTSRPGVLQLLDVLLDVQILRLWAGLWRTWLFIEEMIQQFDSGV